MENPRFPHSLQVKRAKVTNGEIVYDESGDPTYEDVSLSIVAMMDGEPVRNSSGAFVTSSASSIKYGYRTEGRNTQTASDVVVSDYKIACPMFTTELLVGDRLYLTDYDRSYIGEVVKKTTFNFGTNIWFNEVKN